MQAKEYTSQDFNSRPHGGRQRNQSRQAADGLFQLTPSRRATTQVMISALVESFQLTPSRRATPKFFRNPVIFQFQLTPSRRATRSRKSSKDLEAFQLTPSRRATCNLQGHPRSRTYFNSRPHGGRPSSDDSGRLMNGISTHALTEGDKPVCGMEVMLMEISTHALTEGDISTSVSA